MRQTDVSSRGDIEVHAIHAGPSWSNKFDLRPMFFLLRACSMSQDASNLVLAGL